MRLRLAAALVLLVGLQLPVACAPDGYAPRCPEAMPAAVDDPADRALLAQLKTAHERADTALDGDDRDAAISALGEALGAEVPASLAAREAVADTWVRLAELQLGAHALDEAQRSVDRGLAVVDSGTLTHGLLLEVSGAVELAGGDAAAAGHAFERAASVQRGVLERARACSAETQAVDAALVAFLSLAEVTHHLADLAEQEGDRARAEAILRALFDGPLPGDPPLGPEAREVLGDTLARLAEQESARGELEAARRDIARGLQLATERTLYRGRLMEVLGVVEQRDHEALLAEGRLEEAEAAKKRAIEAFVRAVEIQDDVIRSVLEDDLPLP